MNIPIPIPKLAANIKKPSNILSGIKHNSYIWKTKPVDLKDVKPESLGYVCKDGTINFLNQESAIIYAKNKVAVTAKLGYESGATIKGNRIVSQTTGDSSGVIREDSNTFDIGVHCHPDTYAEGCTVPPGFQDYVILMRNPVQKKEIVFNSKGEYYSLTKLPDYNYESNEYFIKEKYLEHVKEIGELYVKKVPQNMRARYSEALRNKDESLIYDILEDCGILENPKAVLKDEVVLRHKFWQKYAEKLGVETKTNFSNFK